MVGHGRPREGPGVFAGHRELLRHDKTRSARVLLCCCALFICFSQLLVAQQLDVRVRLTWGGGTARKWRGSVVARDGRLIEPRSLGTEADVPDDLVLEGDTLRWSQPIPVRSDGLDLQVIGTAATTLSLE